GSGLVQLPDGRLKRVGFAAQNGHPYVALGKVMIERGLLPREDVTMQSIRAWLRANPSAAPELLKQNPSYVFFRELPPPKDDSDGPLGAQGVALLPGRSLAVDRSHFALGMPLWLAATHPDPQPPHGEKPLRRLMVMQDTGGAIRGAVRGDVFWGESTTRGREYHGEPSTGHDGEAGRRNGYGNDGDGTRGDDRGPEPRPITRTGRGGSHLRDPRRSDPAGLRSAVRLLDPPRPGPPRTGRPPCGPRLRDGHRQGRRLHGHVGPRRHQPRDRDRRRLPRLGADRRRDRSGRQHRHRLRRLPGGGHP